MRRRFFFPTLNSLLDQPVQRNIVKRALLIITCIGVAFAAAILLREKPQSKLEAKTSVATAPLTAAEVLAKIPVPSGQSVTEKALAIAMGKVRDKTGDPVAWVNLGDAIAQMLRDTANESYYEHAESAYRFSLNLHPSSVDAMTGMAWVMGGRHFFDESKEWAARALALDATNAAAFGILGDADVELGDYDAAYDHYQKMMDVKPDLSSWSRGAHLLWLTGDARRGTWLMEKAIKAGAPFAENTAWCRANLAMMLFSEGAFPSTAQALEPALKASPKNPHVLLAAGRIAAAREDYPGAERYFQRILENAPNHEALAALGDLCAVQGRAAEAEKYYGEVEALDVQQFARAGHSHLAMAKFYADHDRKPIEALRMAEERKLTRNVNEADTLAWVYFKNGDQARAIEAIKVALSRKTPNAEIHFHAGMIAAKFGDRVSAQNHFEQALTLNPHFSILQAPLAAAELAKLGGGTTTQAKAETTSPPELLQP